MTEGEGESPRRIRSLAVHREDVASALEATLRSDREVVLRVTPPFSGRMRARLHVIDADPPGRADGRAVDGSPTPIHVDPEDLVAEVPAYPEVDDTAAAHPDAGLETRRDLHAAAVESWRERVRGSIVESVAIDVGARGDGTETGDGPHEVDVAALG